MSKISSSVNIIRDSADTLQYYVTPNAEKTCETIFEKFEKGIHSFNLIGSFGTGKSSFLWALEKSLVQNENYFETPYNGKAEVVKIVGEFKSLSLALNDEFGVENDLDSNQKLFDAIFQRYSNLNPSNSLLVLVIDEFGKFLEFAAKNRQEIEIYFLQKLAEFVNKPDRNILLITSLHQNLETYSLHLDKSIIQEWKKVKGRFSDLTFNEPVEQLLMLASKVINSKASNNSYVDLIESNKLFVFKKENILSVESKIFPLNSISAYVLSSALQKYGQNERSLFTFLNSLFFLEYKSNEKPFELPDLYDYLFEEFYTYLVGKFNPDFSNWSAIKTSLERVENIDVVDQELAQQLLKTLGLMNIFSKSGAHLNDKFFKSYFGKESKVSDVLKVLSKKQVIRFSKFDDSYKLFEGTDLDIDLAISKAEYKISGIDVLSKLNSHFSFPVIIAKSVSYLTGTPRLFEFVLSNEAINELPNGQIDGFVNLIFTDKNIDEDKLLTLSLGSPIIFGYFNNTGGIFETLLEIEKTKEVLIDMQDENDRVAIRELKSIIKSNEILLNHYVMNSLYTDKVSWFSRGNRLQFDNNTTFNTELSNICLNIYGETPIIQNELINRHKTSGSVSSARKSLWKKLTANSDIENLGYAEDKWPADKTIYFTLLEKTGIHRLNEDGYMLGAPTREDFNFLWQVSCRFLDEAKSSRKSVLSLHKILTQPPLKLKQGVIDFWVPLFLYLKRGDFALYSIKNGFIPFIDETVLYMLDRNVNEFEVKSFQLNNLRLNLFNKYRDFLRQENTTTIDTTSFIESIRPLLIFYRDLTEYAKSTKTVSTESVKLRDAISRAKDPEKTFFEDFPEALGYTLQSLAKDEKVFEEYIIDFQNHIEEIKGSFENLLNRFELFIQNEIIGKKIEFSKYKNRLKSRFSSIKEHQALSRHKIFLMRVNSNLNDRDSFLMSLSQALIGKQLDKIKDADEVLLFEKFKDIISELDNLAELSNIKVADNETLLKLEITSLKQGTVGKVVRLSEKEKNQVDEVSERLTSIIDSNKKLKIPILLSMLKKELDNENKA